MARLSRSALMGTALAAVAILAAACSGQAGPLVIAVGTPATTPSPAGPAAASSGPPTQLGSTTSPSAPVPATSVQTTTPPSPANAPVSITVRTMPDISDTVSECPSYQPPWALKGWISATGQATLTYHWSRSDGTSTSPQTITVGPGADAEVTDSVPPPQLHGYPFTDALRVTSPVSVSSSIRVYYYCYGFAQFSINQSSLGAAPDGVPYSVALTGTGGDGMYSWSATGLPPGLSMNSATGVISGVPDVSFPVGVNEASYSVSVLLYYPAGTSQQGAGALMIIDIYR
jgi:hypothetical protein